MDNNKKVKFGQNFLINKEIAKNIVKSCNFTENDNVVEIGPGEGILTDLLADKVKTLTIIEIDPFYLSYVEGKLFLNNNKLKKNDTAKFVNMDVLQFNFIELSKTLNSKLRLISNLPYEISSPIMAKFIKEKEAFLDFTLMFQKEFAERLLAQSDESARSAFSVIAEANFEIELLFNVFKENFNPQPKIDSSVIRMTPLDLNKFEDLKYSENIKWAANSPYFSYLVHQLFKLRRKKLRNSIYASFQGIPPDIKVKMYEDSNIDLDKRPQSLTLNEFIKIAIKYKDYLGLE
ncbi:MAG: ribosomal RNA small subunit methyltransferase A [Candidatus Acididesulfobacter diazotrophicus]|jgi:16S rRNA (adenine1518-N6/adenine1519-N6)-dimethyltransferase|uniref:Ribosomal RNA small subunit methyltransferase A n=1 Tax=Candidatus Acididesulfobacter diazotrophicus TaxID=2597226 RepID=A0A519BPG5_9DELT|nr:MAG: ribosomal RNA small subunit methyltransferase A [Candidatus Acididesulfobacter diazotrophicus]